MVVGRAPINRLNTYDRWTSRVTTHLETTILQEKTTREASQAGEKRPEQILERHDLAEESTRQAKFEAAC